jgi:hypothetical protein
MDTLGIAMEDDENAWGIEGICIKGTGSTSPNYVPELDGGANVRKTLILLDLPAAIFQGWGWMGLSESHQLPALSA